MLTLVGTRPVDVATAIEGHPLAPYLSGTVALGLSARSPWVGPPAGPRIVVLHGVAALDRVARTYLASADGIVVTGGTAPVEAIRAEAAPGVLVATPEEQAVHFLRGAADAEARAAWTEVAAHAALAAALRAPALTPAPEVVADLVVQLVIAAGN